MLFSAAYAPPQQEPTIFSVSDNEPPSTASFRPVLAVFFVGGLPARPATTHCVLLVAIHEKVETIPMLQANNRAASRKVANSSYSRAEIERH